MSESLPAVVVEEERLLATVRANIARLAQGPLQADHEKTLMGLRDSLDGEKLVDDIASIVEQMDRTAALMAQQAKSRQQGRVDIDNPYFGHMVLDDDFGKRSILIGRHTFLSDRVRIVDWRNAPISRLFYQYAEGDDYEETVNGQEVSGEVLTRRTMTVHEGTLRRVADDDSTWVKTRDGRWIDLRDHEAQLAGGAGSAVRPGSLGTSASAGRRDKHLPEIASLLDPTQFELITRPNSGLVVIQGSAGSGKTTVGLHRIAYLNFHAPGQFRPKRMMVMAFSRALSRYISKVLPALGVEGVRVETYPDWARWLRKAHFRHMPQALSDETPAVVSRFKTHTALLRMIEDLRREHRGRSPSVVFEEVLTDKTWIREGIARYAPGAFSDDEVEKIHRWTTRQHWYRSEGGGPNDQDVPCLDAEDDAILLRLHQVIRGPLRRGRDAALTYDHIMVDEAQDMSAIELAVLFETAGKRRSITVAGDAAQQVMSSREFTGWRDVLDALDLAHVTVSPLQVSYRTTRQIMEAARDILGALAPSEPVVAPRDGVPVAHLKFFDMGAAATWLAPALTDLMAREPTANVALLVPNFVVGRDWHEVLERAEVPHVSLVDDQEFSFLPGIEITDVRSAKGLEFDYVVVLNVNADHYPDWPSARHLLHVAATCAAHQLWLVSSGPPSPLIPAGLAGLVA